MIPNIKLIIGLLIMAWPGLVHAQDPRVLSLDTIISRISRNNSLLQSYALKAESYAHSADAATAWMAPMVGVGTFMTPYPGQNLGEGVGKGNVMFEIAQDIPNRAKLEAKRNFIGSQADVERATREVTLNTYKAMAKRLYYNWLIADARIGVLQENERLLVLMKKIEEVRYPYNQVALGGVYQAEAKILENRNRMVMQEGIIGKAKGYLNSLMNAEGSHDFTIDTTLHPKFLPTVTYDTTLLADTRKDIFQMDARIRTMKLNIVSSRQQKKPDFKIRFDHMSSLSAMMPNAFSVMGMMSIPIAPWASKMYQSDIKAMQLNVAGMQKERAAKLVETQGALVGMQAEIGSIQQRLATMEQKIIPALQKSMDAYFANYQENKEKLSVVIDAWEALTMMKMTVLDEKLKLYERIADYEKELYR
ncbi:TolC family protein [Dyadobacter jejuensis]|nr:TolC family protein [Dyadobacter jejuensis]